MKIILAAALFVVAASSFAYGQTNAGPASGSAKVEQEIRTLEHEWFDSYVRGNRAAFDRIVADDAVMTYGNGKVGNKSEAIAEVKAPADASYSLTSDDVKVSVYGDTAIVTGRVTEKGIFNGRSVNSQSRYTDVWVKRNGLWQVVAAQNTRLPQGPSPATAATKTTPNAYDVYVGEYELAPNLVITIMRDGNRLMSELGGRKSELMPQSETQFSIPAANIMVTFVKDASGQVTHMTVSDNGREGQARKVR